MTTRTTKTDVPQPVLETTSPTAAKVRYKSNWLRLRKDQSIGPGRTWIFTDGSSRGWFAAVIIDTKRGTIRRAATRVYPVSQNIGPEVCGLILGLELTPTHSPITVVHDYVGVGAWALGVWRCDPEKKNRRLRVLVARVRKLIRRRKLDIKFIHHGGHQDNGSDFTRWNCEADRLAGDGVEIDETVAWP